MFCVYTLRSSIDDKVFYVGKGIKNRFYSHTWNAKNGSKLPVYCKMRKVWELGGEVIFEKIFEDDNESFIYQREKETIAFYGRDNLMNLTDGGDKAPTGMKHKPETLKKFSQQRKGRSHSPEAISKMKEIAKVRWAGRSPEERRQITANGCKAAIPITKARSKESFSKSTKKMWEDGVFENRKDNKRDPRTGRYSKSQ